MQIKSHVLCALPQINNQPMNISAKAPATMTTVCRASVYITAVRPPIQAHTNGQL